MGRLMAALLFLLTACPAAAECPSEFLEFPFAEIDVYPPAPKAGETVTITVRGEYSDLCWEVVSSACGDVMGQELVINVDSYDCAGRECGVCLPATSSFEITCEYVFDAAGTYLIRADETADTDRTYCGVDVEHALEVAVSVPVEASGWSAIKALYR